jgi:hypothetical protein
MALKGGELMRERKTEHVKALLTSSHKAALRRIAILDGEPTSVILRRLIREEAARRGMWPVTPDQKLEVRDAK